MSRTRKRAVGYIFAKKESGEVYFCGRYNRPVHFDSLLKGYLLIYKNNWRHESLIVPDGYFPIRLENKNGEIYFMWDKVKYTIVDKTETTYNPLTRHYLLKVKH